MNGSTIKEFSSREMLTISLREEDTFSYSCCGILNSWLIFSSNIKADSRGVDGTSISNETSVGKDKPIFTVVFTHNSQYDEMSTSNMNLEKAVNQAIDYDRNQT